MRRNVGLALAIGSGLLGVTLGLLWSVPIVGAVLIAAVAASGGAAAAWVLLFPRRAVAAIGVWVAANLCILWGVVALGDPDTVRAMGAAGTAGLSSWAGVFVVSALASKGR